MNPSLLLRLQFQPDALGHLLTDRTESQIRRRPSPDKWSIFENLAHLGRYQEIFVDRLNKILSIDGPDFGRYRAEDDPGFYEWTQKQFPQLLTDFHSGRSSLLAYLQLLTDDQLQRRGRHPLYGLMPLESWTEFFLLHEAHHFFTILKIGPSIP